MGTWLPGPGPTSGDDTYQGDTNAPNAVDGLAGNDLLNGGQVDDTLSGGDGNDGLAPGLGDDTSLGGAGDDFVNLISIWTGGGDTIDGGAGSDTLNIMNISDTRFEFSAVNLSNFENLVFWVSAYGNVSRVAFAGSQIGPGLSATATITGSGTSLDSLAIEFSSATTFVNTFSYVGWETRDLTILSGSAFNDALTGSAFQDELLGNNGHDTLNAGGGNDRLEGGSGNDTLNGGAGIDFLVIGEGVDIANGGDDNDDIFIQDPEITAGDVFNGGNGFDSLLLFNTNINPTFDFTITTVSSIERIDASPQGGGGIASTLILSTQIGAGFSSSLLYVGSNDISDFIIISMPAAGSVNVSGWTLANWAQGDALFITGSTGADTITGSIYSDGIVGNEGNDILFGGGGSDSLNGHTGADTMYGGDGNDSYSVDNAGDQTIEASALGGTDAVDSSITWTLSANIERLFLLGSGSINGFGNAINNWIVGTTGANQLNGFDGNDILDGGAGADNMFGGNGDDTYHVDNAGDQTTETSALGGIDIVFSSVNRNLTANIENLTLTGSSNLTGSGNTLNNVIIGNTGANTLYGFDGNDRLDGGTGADTLFGANGNDTYVVDDVNDITVEGSPSGGIDTVESSINRNLNANFENLTLTGTAQFGYGNVLNNAMTGNASSNSLYGFDGDDVLDGGAGADQMYGGNGNDTYYVDNAGDVTSEASPSGGVDTVYSTITRNLTANLENLDLLGGGDITGAGNSLNNYIGGNTGANILYGLDGNDRLDGDLGADTLQGGAGADSYLFTSDLGGGNVDTIVGFNVADDTIVLSDGVFTGIAFGTLAASAFVIGAAAVDSDDRIIYNSATGALYFDVDGVGGVAAVQFATLAPGLALTNNDFVLDGFS